MNVKINSHNLRVTENLKSLIDRQATKIGKLLPTFETEDLDIHVNLEKLSRGRQFRTGLVLTTPQRAIRVDDIEDSVARSTLRAFDELVRRVKRFKSQLNRERYWHKEPFRISTRKEVEPGLEEAIRSNLEKIENYVRREIYHRTILGEIPSGRMQPQAVVDQVFLEISAGAGIRPESLPLEQWMFQLARIVVLRSVEQIGTESEQLHLEEPGQEPARWDDESLDFNQPDEVLKLEDLLGDEKSPTPEELLASEETEAHLQGLIAKLPDPFREAYVLYVLEGFNSDEVAMITGKSTQQVLAEVEEARGTLMHMFEDTVGSPNSRRAGSI